MIVELGDILVWKDWREKANPDLDEYFVIVEIDKDNRHPYLALNLSRGGTERFNGHGFNDENFWERVA